MRFDANLVQIATIPVSEADQVRVAEHPQSCTRIIEVSRSAATALLRIPEANGAGALCLLRGGARSDGYARILPCTSMAAQLHAELSASPAWEAALLVSWRFAAMPSLQAMFLTYRLRQLALKSAGFPSFALPEELGSAPQLPEAQALRCEVALEEVPVLTVALGHQLFVPHEAGAAQIGAEIYQCENHGASARGYRHGQGFLVIQGSRARMAGSSDLTARALQEKLEQDGVMRHEGALARFERDHLFESQALAATAVLGRSSTGFFEWKRPDGLTLGEVLRAELGGI